MKSNPLNRNTSWWQNRLFASWNSLLNWCRAEPVVVLGCVLIGAVVGLAANRLLGPRQYSASAGVTVSSDNSQLQSSVMMALATSTGLQLGNTAPPLRFQSAIFESAPFRDSLLLEPLEIRLGACRAQQPCNLFQAFGTEAVVTPMNLRQARSRLADQLQGIRDERSQILIISSQHEDSLTARVTVTRATELLGEINRRLVAEAAAARVAFLSGQVPRLVSELQQIQDSLETFYRQNVSRGTSPELHFREERLRSAYQAQSELLDGLRSQLVQNEIQARGELQLIQTVIPTHVQAKPVRPLRNPALVSGVLLVSLFGYGLWRRRRSMA